MEVIHKLDIRADDPVTTAVDRGAALAPALEACGEVPIFLLRYELWPL